VTTAITTPTAKNSIILRPVERAETQEAAARSKQPPRGIHQWAESGDRTEREPPTPSKDACETYEVRTAEHSVYVPVVDIGIVRMSMANGRMYMRVRMRPVRIHPRWVLMLMVLVVVVPVLMLQCRMSVLVVVDLGDMEKHT